MLIYFPFQLETDLYQNQATAYVCVVCVCVHTVKLRNKGRAGGGERERNGEREAHYNQAIMLAELEASLFSLVAA